MAHCPNKNVPEWKTMVKHVGEREAYRAYMAHNFTIPNAVPTSELKQHISLVRGPFSEQRKTNINRNIRRWNKENGTAHNIDWVPVTLTSSRAEINFNYLPVNKEVQAERDRRRSGKEYTGVEDGESFQNVHDPNKEPFTPSESEQEAGRWEDGEFLTPLFLPSEKTRKGPKFQPLIDAKQQDLKALYSNKDKLITALRQTDDKAKRRTITGKLAHVNTAIEATKQKILELGTFHSLSQIETFAEEDMATLDAIFNTPPERLHISDLHVARRIIKIWTQAGNFSGDQPHIFYSAMEFEHAFEGLEDITNQFIKWQKRAEYYNNDLIQMQQDIIDGKIKDTFDGAEIDFDEALPDIGVLTKEVLDISEVNYVLFQAIHRWVKDANWAAKEEVEMRNEKLVDLIKKTGLRDFEVFQQTFSNTDNRKTGEMVHRWTHDWFQDDRKMRDRLRGDMERTAVMDNRKQAHAIRLTANREYVDEMGNVTIPFDPLMLFEWDDSMAELAGIDKPTDEERKAYIDELKGILGDKAYEQYHKLAMDKLERYKEDLESMTDRYEKQHADVNTRQFHIDTWISHNSPYLHSQALREGFDATEFKGLKPYMSDTRDDAYLTLIPRRTAKDGSDTGYYDDKFSKIENSESQLALYNHMFDLLQELKLYLPYEKVNFMDLNSIPFIKKQVMENMTGSTGSLSKGFSRSREVILESVRMDDLSTKGDPTEEKEHQLNMLVNNRQRINAFIELRTAEYMTNKSIRPDEDTVENWRREIMNTIAEEKSFDLERVMKAFTSMAITYKHRSAIEDQMRIAEDIVKRTLEKKLNPAGDPMTDTEDNPQETKGLEQLNKMLNDFMEVVYWGYPSNKPEGKTDKKVLTKKEKSAISELELAKQQLDDLLANDKITAKEHGARTEVIDDQIKLIGGVKVWSKFGDGILKYIQLKGMGWNVFAAFANLGFGVMANFIEGSDGRNYSMKSIRRAYALTLNSVGRNLSFNQWDGLSGNAKKIRVLMDYYDTLKTSKNELYKTSPKSLFKRIGGKLEFANPYSPQTRTEYLNQAPVMIATLMETMVKDSDGKDISLWDAYEVDSEGKIAVKEGIDFQKQNKLDMETKTIIDKLVKMNHGNYDPDSALSVKRKFMGRALSQFRTWAYQGFAERFRSEFKDFQLTNRKIAKQITDLEFTLANYTGTSSSDLESKISELKKRKNFLMRKGRYKSYVAFYQQNNNMFGVGATLSVLHQLIRKLLWQGTSFDQMVGDKFSETDAANMRKNMTELMFQLFLVAFTLILKAGADEDDDKDKRRTLALNLLINQAGRITTDIQFYVNPIEFERLARNAIPAFSIVVDAGKFVDSAVSHLMGAEDILQSGPNKGESRTWRDLQKMLPLTSQRQRVKSASRQIYKK